MADGIDQSMDILVPISWCNSNFSLRPQALFAPDPAEQDCAKQTTCNGCIGVRSSKGLVCGFNISGQCVGRSTASPDSLAKTPAECKAFEEKQRQEHEKDAEFTKNAKKEWEKIKPHVFGTEKGQSNTSGRHLATALLKVPANRKAERNKNEETGISIFTFRVGRPNQKIKTTWDDDVEDPKYTHDQVDDMCVDAIKAVLKMEKSSELPKSHTKVISISVPSPRGMNLCISVQGNTSVFPGSIRATDVAIGQPCIADAGAVDDTE
ncbi:hypothetical protein E1B28_010319 [Marasmius oreades]|uniref:Uncharacterized protein n=1 Tax=Marasmius oreades TaxID=181124 RepID=A0A9P7RWS2_9AGAR|nr:uncharacterized protein E1B28_010319 [Marasmius oreades]KAG7091269.1 hypothetical protein E1B28_010319 [Marasmius oreades]